MVPGPPDLAWVGGATSTAKMLFAVVVSMAAADWVLSPCEVTVMVVLSWLSPAAVIGMVTVTSMFVQVPAANGPTVADTVVVQVWSLATTSNVSAVVPVFVTFASLDIHRQLQLAKDFFIFYHLDAFLR